jgi:nuclear pore complex protein Nup43
VKHTWESIHKTVNDRPSPCNALAQHSTSSTTILTGGNDGKINIISLDSPYITQTIGNKDTSPVSSLVSYHHSEVLSANFNGILMLWDIRVNLQSPVKTMPVSREMSSILCLSGHPTQPHIVAAGIDKGMISFIDLRKDAISTSSLIQAHANEVWEVMFHPEYPNNFLTCSQDGQLYHWSHKDHSGNLWSPDTVTSVQFDVYNLLPSTNTLSVNSFDVKSDCIICVTDNESLYVLPFNDIF